MRILVGHDDVVAAWVGRKIGVPIAPPYTALGWIDREGTLKVGFIFYGYAPGGNIDLAIAASGRLTRGILRAASHYMFEQMPCRRCTARPPRRNQQACDMLRRAGFVQEAICKSYYGNDDAVQFRMLKSECRWLT